MRRRQGDKTDDRRWFLSDRPIGSEQDDHLDGLSVAATLAEAIASAEPPCMIGLLGGFGSGKSSVTSLAAARLDRTKFDPVTVSADKHSGNARARNLVHGIAGELQNDPKISSDKVAEILRPLRQSTKVTALDPTDTVWGRFMSGRYSFWQWFKSFWIPLFVAAVLSALGLLAGGLVKSMSLGSAALLAVVWLSIQLASSWAKSVKGLRAGASLSDYTPRAEAADEIEVVFGRLVDLHHTRTGGRRLVVFVDDIDRLSKDDLLDALRSLRSLQSVPRGAEPVFVISCDESILRTAVRLSLSHPATADEHKAIAAAMHDTPSEDPESTPLADRLNGKTSDHEHPALAFVDKLLTSRVQMPPAMHGDMRRFALRSIASDHPLRLESAIDIERIVSILIHDRVARPRSVVRLLNRFIAAYLLAKDREERRQVAIGDITRHTDVLAQLCVLLDEYPRFYQEVVDNTVLLAAARKVALRDQDFTASEFDALRRSAEFQVINEDAVDMTIEFVQPSLRRFLSGTARRVTLPVDVGPLVYFMATPGGRVLGAQVRAAIISGVESGDHDDLARILNELPEDQMGAAAEEIEQRIRDASTVDASTYISAIGPNLSLLGDGATSVSDACAELLGQAPNENLPASVLTEVIRHTGPERHGLLCQRLLRPDIDIETTNGRMVHVAEFMAQNPQVRSLVEPAITDWVTGLPDEGSWDLARSWLTPAAIFDDTNYKRLREEIAVALVRSIRSEEGFHSDDADRLVALIEETASERTDAAPNAANLGTEGPVTRATFVHLWQLTAHDGTADDALVASRCAADGEVQPEVRLLAIDQVANWVDAWVDAEWDPEEDGEDAELGEVPEVIVNSLASATINPATLGRISDVLPDLAVALGQRAVNLVHSVSDAALELAGEDVSAEKGARALVKVVDAAFATDHQGIFDEYCTELFAAIDSEDDPSDPVIELALQAIPIAVQYDPTRAILGQQVQQWSHKLIGYGSDDQRSRIAGLRGVDRADRSLIKDYSDAEHVVEQIRQYIVGGDHPRQRLYVLTQFPWPESCAEQALSTVHESWEQATEETQHAAFELLAQVSDEFRGLHGMHSHLANAVEVKPSSATSKIAADELYRMSPEAAKVVYASAVGRHLAVTSQWDALDTETAGQVIAMTSDDDETVQRLLNELSSETQADVAGATMSMLAAGENVPESAIRIMANHCEESDLAEASHVAMENLGTMDSITVSASRVLIVARERNVAIDTSLIQDQVADLLPQMSAAIAELLGRVLKGVRPKKRLSDALRELRAKDSGLQSIAGAFDAGRRAR